MPAFTTLSLRANEQPGSVGSLAEYSTEREPVPGTQLPGAIVAVLAMNIFVIAGVISFSFLYFWF